VRPRRATRTRAVAASALIGTAGLLAAACSSGADRADPHYVPRADVDRCPAARAIEVGVFRESDPSEVNAFEAWLGCQVDVVVDYSARDTWVHISAPTYLLDTWEGEPRRLVLGVAMLPEQEPADIAAGAAGEYDRYFTELAQLLVARGRGDSVLRIGWEFNLSESPWFTEDSAAFRAYWRRIVAAMSVPGSAFTFDWNPNNGTAPVDAVDYYPGDDVVDVVGVDAYGVDARSFPYPDGCDDVCRTRLQQRAWDEAVWGGARGLAFWSAFARQHGKPLSIPEWGLWERPDGSGGAGDPVYLRRMLEFIHDPANNVVYQAYFEFDGVDGAHRLMTTFPAEGSIFVDFMNAGSPASAEG
jgi:hypothetical protein